MGEIYIIHNDLNDKKYIGKAKYGAAHRWREHIGYDLQNNQYIHRAMRKYGVEHFYYEVLETNLEDNILNEREKYWIKTYNSHVPTGYNMTFGGDGGPGRKPLTEQEKHINKIAREQGVFLGPEKNFENYKKTEKYQQDLKKKCKRVAMLDRHTQQTLKEFDSIKEAVQFLGEKPAARVGISNCANGKINHSYGYKWKFI
jgi:group I intron endonuclease